MGVFLPISTTSVPTSGLPHVRGGVSINIQYVKKLPTSSPRAWGCFFQFQRLPCQILVFPTCVGVFPSRLSTSLRSSSLPHVRGGVSIAEMAWKMQKMSSPRAWGCFSMICATVCVVDVFPTCVGVFLRVHGRANNRRSLPHVRGGVSYCYYVTYDCQASSPRAWGCFFARYCL